jgi:hypothetical protein
MDEFLPGDELILKYIDGEISAAEKDDFENQLLTDPILNQRVEQFRKAKEAIRYYGLQNKVAAIGEEWKNSTAEQEMAKRKKVFFLNKAARYSLAVAASIIVIFILVNTFWFSAVTPDSIYRDMYVDYSISSSRSVNNALTTVEQAWEKAAYAQVIAIGRKTLLKPRERLLYGLAHLKLNKSTEASNIFLGILQENDNPFRQDAEFYLALSYIKSGEYKKAHRLLTGIYNDPRHLYHRQVSEKALHELEKW